ncbi:MAG: hypothetical protein KGH75_00305 [Rhodospirillales bacterium]|nr:hypothetical protein [Rhodospirillales bacterium]
MGAPTTHTGGSPQGCPACAADVNEANRLRNAKVGKVYGRATTTTRKRHAANLRAATEIGERAWRTHHQAIQAAQHTGNQPTTEGA